MRVRPASFPTIRIAQFAFLLNQSSALFSKIIETDSIKMLNSYFSISCSEYWQNHYTFDVLSPAIAKRLGKTSVNLLLINTIIPFIFAYGKQKDDEKYINRALDFLDELPAEANHIISNYKNCGVQVENAKQSQALLQLYKYYCTQKSCLKCSIGDQILKS